MDLKSFDGDQLYVLKIALIESSYNFNMELAGDGKPKYCRELAKIHEEMLNLTLDEINNRKNNN